MLIDMYIKGKQYDKAYYTILGFEYKGYIYISTLRDIPLNCLIARKLSRGRGYAVAIRIKKADKVDLINKGAIPLCKASEFVGGYNKGDTLERLIRARQGVEHKHDNIPFYKGCDMVINGIGYSIKWQNAQLYYYSTIERLVAID